MHRPLSYRRLGIRFCIRCYTETGNQWWSIDLDVEDTEALRREVMVCSRCKLMSIGEKIPKSLNDFFDSADGLQPV